MLYDRTNGIRISDTISKSSQNILLKTKEDINNENRIQLLIYVGDTEGTYVEVSNEIILIEGEYTNQNIDYFEGMKSVGELEDNKLNIEVLGENLFDVDYFTDMIESHYDEGNYGYEIKDEKNTIWVVNDHRKLLNKNILNNNYKFKENTQYIIKGNVYLDENNPTKYNSLRGQVNYTDGTSSGFFDLTSNKGEWVNKSILTDENKTVNYMQFTFGDVDSKAWFDLDSLYIAEYNPDKTKFNYDYNAQNIEINLNQPLRALPNGVKDRIIKRNGQWVIERKCEEIIFDGSDDEDWVIDPRYNSDTHIRFKCYSTKNTANASSEITILSDKLKGEANWEWDKSVEQIDMDARAININIKKTKLDSETIISFKNWLSQNPIKAVYMLKNSEYESLNTELSLNTYLNTTHISNNSTIPANIKVTINRTINRAIEAIELAKINPTVENLSKARMWTNLVKESLKKDELQEEINNITEVKDLEIEKKAVSANVDIYIKSENSLSMTLSTNSIMFEDYSGVSDIEKLNALEITVNSSLPYDLNAYLENEIQNSDKSTTIDSNLLQIKESSNLDYKTFNNTTNKVILEEDCPSGNYNKHNIDLKMEGSNAYKADVYKTVIKFEAEQK